MIIELEKIKDVFNNIPKQKILQITNEITDRLERGEKIIEGAKGTGEGEWDWRTEADTRIQKFILDYFDSSSLSGSYKIDAEEADLVEVNNNDTDKQWKLVIDPLDGTSSFSKGQKTWGVMVGACDLKNNLFYSWNMVSSGEVFDGEVKDERVLKRSFKDKINTGEKINIDVYDYKSGASERFGEVFEGVAEVEKINYNQTSYPAAVWAGWELYNGNLDGLLWLPSDQGKKWYPNYDLIFLGALIQKGYKIRIGKLKNNNGLLKNAMIVIAPSEEDVNILWNTGLAMTPQEQSQKIIAIDILEI